MWRRLENKDINTKYNYCVKKEDENRDETENIEKSWEQQKMRYLK